VFAGRFGSVVIPVTALGACARLLAGQFERLSVFRLEDPECVRFKQIVVFGKRKKSQRGDPKGADALLRAHCHLNSIPALSHQAQERYSVPPSAPVTIQCAGLPLDEIEDALQRSTAMQNARGILVRKLQMLTGRPVLPLHAGSVGLLA
jgi:Uncharacterised methyltransferase family (DUF6094)